MRELLQESSSSGVDKYVGIALGVAGGVIVITGIIWFLYRRYAGLGGNLAGIAPERKMLVFTDLGRLANSAQQQSLLPGSARPPPSSRMSQQPSPAGPTSPRPTASRPTSASRTPSPPPPALSTNPNPLEPLPSTPGSISSPRGQGRTLFTSAWERTSNQPQTHHHQPHHLHHPRSGNLQSAGVSGGAGPSGSAPSTSMAAGGDHSNSRRVSATGGGGGSGGPPFSYSAAVMAMGELEAAAAAVVARPRLSSAGRSTLRPSASGAGPHSTHGATSTSRPSSGAPGTRPGSAGSASAVATGTSGPPAAAGGGSRSSRSGLVAPGAAATVLPPALVASGSVSIAWHGPMSPDAPTGVGAGPDGAGVGYPRPPVSHSPLEPFLTAIPRPHSPSATGPLTGSAAAAAACRTSYCEGPSSTSPSPTFGLPISGRPPLPGRSPGPGQTSPAGGGGTGMSVVAAPSAAACGTAQPSIGIGAGGAWGLRREHSPPQQQSGGRGGAVEGSGGGGVGAQSRGRPGGFRTPRTSQPNASRPSSTGAPDESASGTSTRFHSFTSPADDTAAANTANGATGTNGVDTSGTGAGDAPTTGSGTPPSVNRQPPQPQQLSHALISFRQYGDGDGDGGGTDGSLQAATETPAGSDKPVSVGHVDERFTFYSDVREAEREKERGKEGNVRSPATVAVMAAAATIAEKPVSAGGRTNDAGTTMIKLDSPSDAGARGGGGGSRGGGGGGGGGGGAPTTGSSPASSPTQLAWAAAMTMSNKLFGRSSRTNSQSARQS